MTIYCIQQLERVRFRRTTLVEEMVAALRGYSFENYFCTAQTIFYGNLFLPIHEEQ